jgi:hypothetical protein
MLCVCRYMSEGKVYIDEIPIKNVLNFLSGGACLLICRHAMSVNKSCKDMGTRAWIYMTVSSPDSRIDTDDAVAVELLSSTSILLLRQTSTGSPSHCHLSSNSMVGRNQMYENR